MSFGVLSFAFLARTALPRATIAFAFIISLYSSLFYRLNEFYSAIDRFNMFVNVITNRDIITYPERQAVIPTNLPKCVFG